jgi:hypothetical protein
MFSEKNMTKKEKHTLKTDSVGFVETDRQARGQVTGQVSATTPKVSTA